MGIKDEDDQRILRYDHEGKEIKDKNPFLTNLWNCLSLKETNFLTKSSESARESLDYSKIIGPISSAHQDIKAVIMLLDSILSNPNTVAGYTKLAKSIPNTNPTVNLQASLYLESAQKL